MGDTLQPYIDLGWNTVPLKGSLERNEDGSKTIPKFEAGWKERYHNEINEQPADLGGVITGEVSGIMAIDCDNEQTWKIFRALDPDYDFALISRGKGYPAGTLIYKYDQELSDTFTVHDGELDLDFYSDKGFIYLATAANKTKIPLVTPLPELQTIPLSTKILLKQLTKRAGSTTAMSSHNNILTANCLAPVIEQFTTRQEFTPGLFKVITPKDFRDLPQYQENGYLHPNDIPDGRGSEYLMKVSAILGADVSVTEELYATAMVQINGLFESPLATSRLEKTILDPMLSKSAAVGGVPIWKYDSQWSEHRLILSGKRQVTIELAFDDLRNTYYCINSAAETFTSFNRDGDLMAYIEAVAVSTPKKLEIKRSLPLVQVCSIPNLPFGFSPGGDPTARLLNTFKQTPELMVFNNPESYADRYKRPTTILRYLESLVPDELMRDYLVRFTKTKLTTFNYSPVVLYFMGVHGSGKDLFVGLFETILGKVARPTTKEFLEMFNGWMLDTYIVQLDEYGNQLTSMKEREETLGRIKTYTGKQVIQIRQMRTDGFMYKHHATFIMTANRNPLMLEEGDRRIAFFQTPNVLTDQKWVKDMGGVAEMYDKIQEEIKDFCYYLATEVPLLNPSDYVKPPEGANKMELIADSMYAAQRIAFAIKKGMQEYLVKLAESYDLSELATQINMGKIRLSNLDELYDELTDYNGEARNFRKVLRNEGIELRKTTFNTVPDHIILMTLTGENPFSNEEDD